MEETEKEGAASDSDERMRRWRLILGGGEAEGTGFALSDRDSSIDRVLSALYDAGRPDAGGSRSGGLGSSSPKVSRWLGDIREYFPSSVVRIMQKDALERLNMKRMLLEPEFLEAIEADVHLVADLAALSGVIPNKTKETASMVVRKVLDGLMRKIASPTRQAVMGSLDRSSRKRRPRHQEIDWHRTIRANLKNYQPDLRTIIPEILQGYGRRRSSLRDIILCVDQSGSMGTSVVYSGIFGAVLASLPAVSTRVIVFDTAVVDLTEKISDPVDFIFGVELGGGTDIARALGYCQGLVTRPSETILVLISDLFEGGKREDMLKRAAALISSGVQLIALLALSDDGTSSHDHENAAALAALGSPAFACTPDLFPDLMAAAISRRDLGAWASSHDIAASRATPS